LESKNNHLKLFLRKEKKNTSRCIQNKKKSGRRRLISFLAIAVKVIEYHKQIPKQQQQMSSFFRTVKCLFRFGIEKSLLIYL